MNTSFEPMYVVLAYVISVIGSFIALSAGRHIVRRDGSISKSNLLAAGLALGGIGVWSMHFVGMLALRADLTIGYAMTETLVSLFAAVVATSLALYFVARNHTMARVVTAGAVLGLGVCVMHYLGMYGMRFGGYFRWSPGVVALSVLIAITAAIAALWLAFNTSNWFARGGAAMVMGGAVCAMHYTGMAAAELVCTTANRTILPRGFGVVSTLQLPTLVVSLALGIAAILAIQQVVQGGTDHVPA
ncbi:MHYT domain-containing protein [Ramlibacter sp.]|uniref:MHYT domain-containing protein n=1 Tax=Ramlibacter sp. TaxID=1917967 RepID=UPI00260F7602|nr:MHYT domain-containing protein [Ramlibacter sp.]